MASIKQRGNSYLIRVSCGTDGFGLQRIESMTWKPDKGLTPLQVKKELNTVAVMFEEQVKNGLIANTKMKFSNFSEKWLNDYAINNVKPNTLALYKLLLKRITPALGHLYLQKIQPLNIVDFYASLNADGLNKNTGGKLSKKTIRHHHTLLKTMLETAVKWGLITTNPCNKVTAPKLEGVEAGYLNPEQSRHLLNCLDNEPLMYRVMIQLILYSGMRRGEVAGLEWNDIDFTKNIVHIQRSSSYLYHLSIII